MTDERYTDADGNVCTLDVMCRREPEWAANMIRLWRGLCHERAIAESAARARIDAALRLLAASGCDCDCGCDTDGHSEDCEPCLGCRVEAALRGIG